MQAKLGAHTIHVFPELYISVCIFVHLLVWEFGRVGLEVYAQLSRGDAV